MGPSLNPSSWTIEMVDTWSKLGSSRFDEETTQMSRLEYNQGRPPALAFCLQTHKCIHTCSNTH